MAFNHHDLPTASLARMAQSDPWVMYLIVRRSHQLSEAELLDASARACLDILDAPVLQTEPWRSRYEAWRALSFRKVVLRARESEWASLLSDEHHCAVPAVGEAALMALPPILRSGRSPLLGKLRVYDPDRSTLAGHQGAEAPAHPDAVQLWINDAAGMSVGKTMAQVGHAALMVETLEWERTDASARLVAWAEAGYPLGIATADADRWRSLHDGDVGFVRDAGLTEVSAGTETVAISLGGSDS
ncbi:peptidyl-tRNA hydrolase [Miltoncostaea oceani]|uniref:peptidyl-tRNA hydrolase n=1 Tax=Miltoncostaea oceani TaxID=2843216 RepID=UPI001C3E4F74|nr:peptidyl-tRNA hydrolase [Miltoncostaea oceani]